MTDQEFEKRLRDIAALAKAQRLGPYAVESDATQALHLVQSMALLLIENIRTLQNDNQKG